MQRMQSKPEYGRGEFALQMYCVSKAENISFEF
jgi:hypothetical protein